MNLYDLTRKSNEMGVTDIDWIKKCYNAANQNDQLSTNQKIELFGNYVIKAEPLPPQNFQNQNQNSYEEQTQAEAVLEKIKQQSLRDYIKHTKGKHPRKENIPAGLRNIGNCCSINSTLQFLHQIPEITDWLFEIEVRQNNSVQSEFISAWQKLSEEMKTTQYHCVNPTNFIQTLVFQESEKEYFESKTQKDATEILLSILSKLDSSLRRLHQSFLLQTNLYRKECFGMQGLNQLFQITEYKNNNSDNHPMLQVQAESQNLKQFLLKEWSNRISVLPQIMVFSINRITYNQSLQQITRINTSFQFDKILNLNFLLQGTQTNKIKIIEQQQDQGIEKIQAQIKALELIIDMYKNENDSFQYTKLSQKKLSLIQQQQQQSEQQNQYQSSFGVNNYFLHSVFIHIGGTDTGHIIVYIFNFYLDKWFKYNDEIVTQVTEEEMFQECQRDVVLITYVNNSQKQKISAHCQSLLETGNKSIQKG